MSASLLRTLVVDDEPTARTVLSEEIESIAPEVEIVGQAENGAQAVERIHMLRPDLVFLDVQMPGMDGFEVMRRIDYSSLPYVVFTTAYDQHAIQAFEVGAVDYLLKPVGQPRLARCLGHIRKLQEKALADSAAATPAPVSKSSPDASPRKIIGKIGHEFFPIDIRQIVAFQADRELVWITTATRRYLASQTLKDLETKLLGSNFRRIHRGVLVNLEHVIKMVPLGGHRWLLTLTGEHEFIVSKRQARTIHQSWTW